MRLSCSLAFAFVSMMVAALASCGESRGSPNPSGDGAGDAGAAGNGGAGGGQGGSGGTTGDGGAGGAPLVCGARRLEITRPDRPTEPLDHFDQVPVVYSTGTGNYLLHVEFWVQDPPSQSADALWA